MPPTIMFPMLVDVEALSATDVSIGYSTGDPTAVWGGWCASTISTTTKFSNVVWDSWTSISVTACPVGTWQFWTGGDSHASSTDNSTWHRWVVVTEPPIPEEIAERELRASEAAERTRERAAQAERAREASELLLRRCCGEDVWQQWVEHGNVRVRGSDGGLFQIDPRWVGHVYELDPQTEEPAKKLCVHPCCTFPVADRVATLVLGLRADQRSILKEANVHNFVDDEREAVRTRAMTAGRRASFVGRYQMN